MASRGVASGSGSGSSGVGSVAVEDRWVVRGRGAVGHRAVPARDDRGESRVDVALVHVSGPVWHGVSSGAAGWDDDLRTATCPTGSVTQCTRVWASREEGLVRVIYWVLKTVVLGPILRLLFRPWVEGAEHIPETGPAIFASNHLSFSDSIFLPLVVPRRMTFLAKSDYFTGEGIKGRLTAAFFKGVGQLPVDRSGGRASEAALRSGLKVLGRGELLGLYPEGTRSPDGRLYKGKTGVARMALEAGVPVIPVAMIDTDKAQPTGTKIPKLIRVGVRVGTPLDFSRYEGMEGDRFVLRSITDEIMYALMELSGQEYVDMYATAMKDRIAREKKNKAKEAAEAAQPGRAASELEDELDGLDDEATATTATPARSAARADGPPWGCSGRARSAPAVASRSSSSPSTAGSTSSVPSPPCTPRGWPGSGTTRWCGPGWRRWSSASCSPGRSGCSSTAGAPCGSSSSRSPSRCAASSRRCSPRPPRPSRPASSPSRPSGRPGRWPGEPSSRARVAGSSRRPSSPPPTSSRWAARPSRPCTTSCCSCCSAG